MFGYWLSANRKKIDEKRNSGASRLKILSQNWNCTGFQPSFSSFAISWGFAPGFYGSRLRRF